MESQLEIIEKQWDEQAEKWNRSIGDDGDWNRRESSDAYLWKYIGNIDNQVALDAGCGNGYLTIKLALETKAKRIIGVDISSSLIEFAKENVRRRVEDHQRIELYHDSITELKTIEDNSIDLIISNYVLMDTPDLDLVMKAFHRVLKSSGRAVIVIVHPCFNVIPEIEYSKRVYTWKRSYYDETPIKLDWEIFSQNVYPRPLSVYFQTFYKCGFVLIDFDEPKFSNPIHQYNFTCAVLFNLKKNE